MRLDETRRPLLSLVVAVFNSERALGPLFESIEAAGAETEFEWEVVFVDNNSRDRSARMLQAFAAVSQVPVFVLHEPRQGVSHARNTGFAAARGDLLGIVDSDCVIARDWPTSVANEFRSSPGIDMVGGRVELFNAADLPISIRLSRERTPVTAEAFNFSAIPGCNMAFRRGILHDTKLYDIRSGPGARIPMGEDLDLVYRTVKAGYQVVYSPDIVVYHNHGRSTVAQLRATQELYAVGRGAFLTKYLLRFHRQFAKRIYWEVRDIFRQSETDNPPNMHSAGSFALLHAVLRGCCLQITDEILRLFARPPRNAPPKEKCAID